MMEIDDKYIKIATQEAYRYAKMHGLQNMLDDIKQEAYLLLCEYFHDGKDLDYVRLHLRFNLMYRVWAGAVAIPVDYRKMSKKTLRTALKNASDASREGFSRIFDMMENCTAIPAIFFEKPSELLADEHPENDASIKEFLARLSSAEYKLVKAYLEGTSLREIARKEGVSRETIRRRKDDAMEKMK